MRPVDKLTDDDRAELRRLCGLCPDLATIRDLANGFAELVRTRGGQRLTAWVEQAEQATITEIRSFANGLRPNFSVADVEALGERITAEVIAPILVTDTTAGGTFVTVGASVGAAAGVPAEADRVLHDADLAMYRCKNARRAPVPAT
jgi:GGDEF domain-containing protein